MTLFELRMKYTEKDLSSYPGDNELRFKAFAPLFEHLYESKVIYRECGFYAIVSVSHLQLTSRGLAANAAIHRKLERSSLVEARYPRRPWRFACRWGDLRLVNLALNAPFISFTLWPQPYLVSAVECLVNSGDHDRAYALLHPEPEAPQLN